MVILPTLNINMLDRNIFQCTGCSKKKKKGMPLLSLRVTNKKMRINGNEEI